MRKFTIFLLFVLVAQVIFAVEFQNIKVAEGLSNRRVFCSAKDKKGFVWFATRVGIDRYNGDDFTHYTFAKNNDISKVRGVVSDRKGHLYAFTEKFIYAYNEALDAFEQISSLQEQQKQFFSQELITALYFDKDNSLWVGTTSGMCYSNDFKKWDFIDELKGRDIFCFSDGIDGDFWVGTSQGISYYYRTALKEYHSKQLSAVPSLNSSRIQSLFFDRATKKLWIGTFSDGLYTYSSSEYGESQLQLVLSTTVPIRSLAKVKNSQMWVGADGGGIYVYDLFAKTLYKNYTQADNDGNFESNSIYHLLADENKVWVSTYSAGILMCNINTISKSVFSHQKENSNSILNNHVNAILEDTNANLWFGTNLGISKYNASAAKWTHFLGGYNQPVVILAMCEAQNYIWAGGYAADLYCINKSTGSVSSVKINYPTKNNKRKNYIYSIDSDPDGNLWFGGNLDELTKYNPVTKTTKFYNILGIHKICALNQSRVLVATIHGLYVVNSVTNKILFFDFSTLNYQQKKLSSFLNSMYVDPLQPDIVWLGSEGDGLLKFNIKTRKLQVLNTDQGLSSNFVYGILNDSFGRLWISTENGLNCFNLKTLSNQSFFELDGLPENTFNLLAYTKLKNGNMIWGTPKGAVEIIPENIRKKSSPINLRFTTFSLFYQKVDAGQENSPLSVSIDDAQEIKLRYSQSSFSFDFIDLNYSVYPQILYSWKLDGLDKDWSIPTKEHRAVYTNVPPGNYTFMLKATKLGNRNETVMRSITVSVGRPFWSSTVAYLIYFVLLILLIRFINNFWKNRIEAHNSEEKIRFFVNMAHDVRTPITLVKAPLNEIENENLSDDGRSALNLAQRNLDKLFNMVTQLLDFQKADNNSMKLLVEKTALKGFIQSVVNNFTSLTKEKRIELELTLPDDDHEVWIDRKKLALCLENLLSNSIKYSVANGKIHVTVMVIEELLRIEVSDNGIGIPAKDQKKLFERFYRAENAANSNETGSGIGLMLTKKLITLHKGQINYSSMEGVGTSFIFELPCWESSFSSSEIMEKLERVDGVETQAEMEAQRKGVKIMLVEDNDEMRNYLGRQLRREYDVVEASNGNDALELIKTDAPDFVLSDIMMPGISGIELCATLKKRIETCHIPVILLSSLSDRSDIVNGFNAGADDYITKPFDLTILETKIKAILKNRTLFKKKYIAKTAQQEEFASINDLDKVFMERVIKYIEDNLTNDNFTIDHLALEMAMSRSVFYKKLKSLTDENPKDLIKEIKMRKASELLCEGKLPITEIAFMTGFPNAKYFSTAFKKFYGVSPSRYVNGDDAPDLDDEE